MSKQPDAKSEKSSASSASDNPRSGDPAVARDGNSTTETLQASGLTVQMIAGYRLLRVRGEGGMGVVYEAEQLRPVRRRVALKLIRPGMDTERVVARFESERQALALMSHSNIARVFDAGQSEDGRPYFVMEFVEGVPITQYCDERCLPIAARLELYIQVCEGVQHAHQKGIIHRDLKPSNILVQVEEGRPVPKIIDFGVAKATGWQLSGQAGLTEFGQVVGTPEYMSPEQADLSAHDVDTRTDIYALGVGFYELLTGQLPFDPGALRRHGIEEAWRTIREVEPRRPSLRVSTLGEAANETARRRSTEPAALVRGLRGDLDRITMKTLEKDRSRRYGSAAELALDLGRYVKHEPVLASPPSTLYRAHKFVRRHRVGVTASAVILIAVFGGGILATVGLVRARAAEARARREAETARQVSDFLVQVFNSSDPWETQGKEITVRDVLDRGAGKIERQLGSQPLVRARLMRIIGNVYTSLGLHEKARPLLEGSLRMGEAGIGDEPLEAAEALKAVGRWHSQGGDGREGVGYYQRALKIQESVLGPEHPTLHDTLDGLADVYLHAGLLEEAEKAADRSLEILERRFGKGDPSSVASLNVLAGVHWGQGQYLAAADVIRDLVRIHERAFGPDGPWLGELKSNLGLALCEAGQYEESFGELEGSVRISSKALGPGHSKVADHRLNLGYCLYKGGEYERARSHLEGALANYHAAGQGRSPHVGVALTNLGHVQRTLGEPAARATYVRTLAILETSLGQDHPDVAEALDGLARLEQQDEHGDKAVPLFERALRIREEKTGPDSPQTLETLEGYAAALRLIGREAEALALEGRAAEIRRHPDLRRPQ